MERIIQENTLHVTERRLLDKAIIGMGAMVDLVERFRVARAVNTDPEALAAEALDVVKVANAAAQQARRRAFKQAQEIVANHAESYGEDSTEVFGALQDLNRAIEREMMKS